LGLSDKRLADSERFNMIIESNPDRKALKFRIQLIRAFGITRVVHEESKLSERIIKLHTKLDKNGNQYEQ
jgi:hypothetical protein